MFEKTKNISLMPYSTFSDVFLWVAFTLQILIAAPVLYTIFIRDHAVLRVKIKSWKTRKRFYIFNYFSLVYTFSPSTKLYMCVCVCVCVCVNVHCKTEIETQRNTIIRCCHETRITAIFHFPRWPIYDNNDLLLSPQGHTYCDSIVTNI